MSNLNNNIPFSKTVDESCKIMIFSFLKLFLLIKLKCKGLKKKKKNKQTNKQTNVKGWKRRDHFILFFIFLRIQDHFN